MKSAENDRVEAQMILRPVPAPGLWNTSPRPEPRVLLPGGYLGSGADDIYLDQRHVVAEMISVYPEHHRDEICHDLYEELRRAVQGF